MVAIEAFENLGRNSPLSATPPFQLDELRNQFMALPDINGRQTAKCCPSA